MPLLPVTYRFSAIVLALWIGGCDKPTKSHAVPCETNADCKVGTECRGQVCIEPLENGDNSASQESSTDLTDPTKDPCTAGMRFCHGREIYQCRADGQGAVNVGDCKKDEFCQIGTAVCQPQICEPHAPACAGTISTLCNDDGSSVLLGGVDCSVSGQFCINGVCGPRLCEPLSFVCVDDDVHQCANDGLSTQLHLACDDEHFCQNGQSLCLPHVCSPGRPSCDGDRATLCNGNGSGFEPGGSDCLAVNQRCKKGLCVMPVCMQNAYFCRDGNVRLCAPNGLSSDKVDSCDEDEFCRDGVATCQPQVCTPTMPACDGLRATLCNADGSGYEPGGIDCAATGQTCLDGACM